MYKLRVYKAERTILKNCSLIFSYRTLFPKKTSIASCVKHLILAFFTRTPKSYMAARAIPRLIPSCSLNWCWRVTWRTLRLTASWSGSVRVRMNILYFLGYDIDEELPWHSIISRTRQLYPVILFETLFNKVFTLCVNAGMLSSHTQAVDSAPIKANASIAKRRAQSPCHFPKKSSAKSKWGEHRKEKRWQYHLRWVKYCRFRARVKTRGKAPSELTAASGRCTRCITWKSAVTQ